MYTNLDEDSRTQGLPPPTRNGLEKWLNHLKTEGWNLLAYHDDRVVGHAAVAPIVASTPKVVVFIHQEFRNRGVGTELLKQLVVYVAGRGYEALQVTIAGENRQAITLCRNVGFEILDQMACDPELRLSLQRPIAEHVQHPPTHCN
jgi:RimJ/RimL family protein N-acetyltransferase